MQTEKMNEQPATDKERDRSDAKRRIYKSSQQSAPNAFKLRIIEMAPVEAGQNHKHTSKFVQNQNKVKKRMRIKMKERERGSAVNRKMLEIEPQQNTKTN